MAISEGLLVQPNADGVHADDCGKRLYNRLSVVGMGPDVGNCGFVV